MASANVYSPDYDNQGNPKRSIPELKDAIENAINNAVSNVEAAQNDAVSAVDSREQRALDNIDDAQLDVEAAKTAAEDAEKYAVETGPFTDSDGIDREQGAKGWALEAEAQRNLAETAATDAEDAANTATAEADAASGHADDARQAATDAQNSADDALASSSFVDIVDTEADLSTISSPSSGDQALVRDDTANANGYEAIYEYDGSAWSFTGHSLVSEGERNAASGFVGLDQDGYVEHERAIYVDSRNGLDSNDGKSATSAVKTLAEAEAIASNEGITQVRLRRGSIFREAVMGLAGEVDYIGAYGDGALPVLAGDEIIDESNITTETAPNGDTVYKFDTTTQTPLNLGSRVGLPHPQGNPFNGLEGQSHKMMFEGEQALVTLEQKQNLSSEGEYLDLLTQNPGRFYIPGDSSPDPARQNDSITDGLIYFLPHDSTDPTSDGKTYSYSVRSQMIRGQDMILEDFAYGRWFQRYPFNMTYCVIRNVHGFQIPQHTLMARSSYLEGCSADNREMGFSGFHGFHDGNQYDSRGPLGLVYRDCVAKTDGDASIAFYSHGGGSPAPRPYSLMENCRAPGGWKTGIGLGNAQLLIATNYRGTGDVTTNVDLLKNGYMKSGGGAQNRTNTLPKRLDNVTVVMVGNGHANRDSPFTADLTDCALISTGGRYDKWVQNGEADITLDGCIVGDFNLEANDFTVQGGTQSYVPEAGVLRDVQATMEADPAGTDRLLLGDNFSPAREAWLFGDSGTAPNGESYNAVMEVNNFGSGVAPLNRVQCWEFQGGPFPSPWAVEVADYEASGYTNGGDHTVYLRQALPSGTTFDGSTDYKGQVYALLQAVELQRANESFSAYANSTNDKLRFVRTGLTPAEAKRYIASGQYLHVEGVGVVETASVPYDDGNVSGSWVVDLAESYPVMQEIEERYVNGYKQSFEGGNSYLQNRYEFTVQTNLPIYKPTGDLRFILNSTPDWLKTRNIKDRNGRWGFESAVPPSLQGVDQAGDSGVLWNEQNAFATYAPVAYNCSDPENPAPVQIDVSWRILDEEALPIFTGDFKNGEQAFQAPDSPQQGLGPIPEEGIQAESIGAQYRLNNVT